MNKIIKIILKSLLILLVSIISLFVTIVIGLNVAKFAIYHNYYSMETSVCRNPGLNDGFVCQGITFADENNKFLVSGYMKDNSNSRIYITDEDNDSYYVMLEKDNKPFTGHVGGIATTYEYVYLANDNKIYIIELEKILSASNGDTVDVGEGFEINNQASFVYTDEKFLYVGEFHNGNKYVTDHPYETKEGMHYAIVTKYNLTNLSKPVKIYSIRDKVQGICFTPDGKVVMSTSYGITDTKYYIYNEDEATKSEHKLDGTDVYYLENCLYEFNGPAMGEDLDFYRGKVITLTESASNKYIFGKLFFANKIVSLDYNKNLDKND